MFGEVGAVKGMLKAGPVHRSICCVGLFSIQQGGCNVADSHDYLHLVLCKLLYT